jgi:small subunit ribosomal protein S18
MARSSDRDRSTTKRAPKEGARRGKKKVDIIARDSIEWVDYKDVNLLRKFMSDRGKIRARRVSGLSVQNQRAVAKAIKLARELALVPYATRTVTERTTPRTRPPRDDRPSDVEATEPSEVFDEIVLDEEEDA